MKGRQGGGREEKVRECKGGGGAARASSTQSSNRSCVPRVSECGRGVGVGVGRAASSHSRRDLRILVKGVWESIDHAAISLEGYQQTGAGGCDTPTIIIIAGYWRERRALSTAQQPSERTRKQNSRSPSPSSTLEMGCGRSKDYVVCV